MDTFKTDILDINKKGRTAFWLVVSGITIAVATLMILKLIPLMLPVVWMAVLIYSFLRFYLQTRKQVLKKSGGRLELTDQSIRLQGETFRLEDLDSISVSIAGWRSYSRSNDRSMPVNELHTGDKNYISFIHSGKEHRAEFLLASHNDWELLRHHVISWYQRGLKVVENHHGNKTYGLEMLNYAEIQEFKRLISPKSKAK
ncbi:MAG: hypothetical protein K0Q66_599 [Chitinophagaceae bacterium]|jgi:hypothetical protein|nr:hypothetical protein [Chitinophagaceae bacterium]